MGQYWNDSNNRMIQLTDVICVLFRYNGTSDFWLQEASDSIISDSIKRRALYKNNSQAKRTTVVILNIW